MIDYKIKEWPESSMIARCCSCGRLTPYIAPMYVHKCNKCLGLKQTNEKNDKPCSTK